MMTVLTVLLVTHYNIQILFCIMTAKAAGPHSEVLQLIMLTKCYTLHQSPVNFILFFFQLSHLCVCIISNSSLVLEILEACCHLQI